MSKIGMTMGEKIDQYEEEIATMKVMIYSLHQSIDDICYGLTKQHVFDKEKWEKECRKVAKSYIKRVKNDTRDK